ncbi:hypothetical protein P170DRAFT_266959 [Aspergillus steynii IBT 23096]|uniref:Uncharacterized protein n=1 Tax=Aspergillus steynii IBT 23096 TaxID=1392250 RepID=A0A2I2FVY3_9EURO|nr:uncharacterized protein P170DRAFT_266959 [Aspergillus steynii IBT 23096]PLB44788.1 hypothetical protein P170DRAFT_266959 [Aspergillus steynii IBT 23096]
MAEKIASSDPSMTSKQRTVPMEVLNLSMSRTGTMCEHIFSLNQATVIPQLRLQSETMLSSTIQHN